MKNTNTLMSRADDTVAEMKKNYFDTQSQVNKKLIKLLDELTRTSRSVKKLSDYLERHPESLIKGK